MANGGGRSQHWLDGQRDIREGVFRDVERDGIETRLRDGNLFITIAENGVERR